MHLNARFPATRVYGIEISGWDCKEQFFVERCELQWSEESGKQVRLKRAVHDNAILLVRLLQGGDPDRSQPVAYEAEGMGRTKTGMYQFRLNMVAPRRRDHESSAAEPGQA
jgi:hypothetical protein